MTAPTGWPTHGNAVNCRNDTAELVTDIVTMARKLKHRVRKNEVSSDEIIFVLSEIGENGLNALRLLESQGAPTRPMIS